MSGTFFLFPQQVINSTGQQFVLNNAAVTIDGHQVISGLGSNVIMLLINIKNAPSGTNPTITFTMQEVDPIDQSTSTGASVSSAALNAAGVTQLTMSNSTVGTVKVSWHITGTNTPTFTGVNVTILQKVSGSTVTSNIGTTGGLALDTTLTGGTQTTRITNGTNTAAVKAASTAPLATDPALVVTVSPNNSGTNAVQVQGTTPDNITFIGNPVVAAGIDPTGRVQNVGVDGYGNIKVVNQLVPSGSSSSVAFGQANTGAQAGTLTPLRQTTYNEQTTNGQRSLKSTSVNDTALGTGARKVMITYFDASLNGPFTETVTLNGTLAVATVNNNICFIENMIVTNVGTAGSNGGNLGTISLYTDNAGLGTVIGSIGVGNIVTAGTVGDNRTLWAHHYIVPGKTCSVTTISGGTTGNQTGVTFLRYINPLVSDACHIQITGELVVASAESSMFRPSTVPLLVSGPAKITQYAVSNGTNTTFFGGFQFFDS